MPYGWQKLESIAVRLSDGILECRMRFQPTKQRSSYAGSLANGNSGILVLESIHGSDDGLLGLSSDVPGEHGHAECLGCPEGKAEVVGE